MLEPLKLATTVAHIIAHPPFLDFVNEGKDPLERLQGGIFVVYLDSNSLHEPPQIAMRCGSIEGARSIDCMNFAFDKAQKLLADCALLSSYEKGYEGPKSCGGAIRARHCILSFSGFGEKTNEALMLLAARKNRLLNLPNLDAILEMSSNVELFSKLEEVTEEILM